jgi:predicted lipoprotein with Yx(FWY)xxD motif
MRAGRLPFAPLLGGLVIAIVVAACSVAGGSTQPPTSQAPLGAASVPPATSQAPSVAPTVAASVAPAASPTADATATSGSGGRYGGGGGTPTAKPTSKPTPKPTPKPTAKLTVKSGSTSLGTVLVGSDGLTLYFHAGDSSTHSTCTGSCASNWPPLLVKAGTTVSGGSGVHGAFATFKRSDGTTQVTYKGHPLYAFTGDYSPGDATGQGIGGFSVAKV